MTRPASAPPTSWRWHAGAVLLYAGVCIIFLGHGVPLRAAVMGSGGDPFQFVWFFAWWPWAIMHHVNPFYAHVIWQPLGVPMLWITSVPLLALLAAPVTLTFGPELALNLMFFTAPILAALSGYLLCLRITRQPPAALIGGFIVGFSGYEMAANLATINLSFVLLAPLLLLLALRRLDGDIGRLRCVLLASAMMVAQFFISIELFATYAFFAVVTWLVAFRVLAPRRPQLLVLLIDAMIGAAVTAVVLAPFLLLMARDAHYVNLPVKWPYIFTASVMNFFIPSGQTLLGARAGLPISRHFIGGPQEQDAYLGLPLLLMIALFARERWRTPGGVFLLLLFGIFVVASLGPCLRIESGFTRVILPWYLFVHLPFFSSALPGRFGLFVSLVAGVIAGLWVSKGMPGGRGRWRLALGIFACVALLPAPHKWMPIPRAGFFVPGRLQAVLGPNPRILVLPFGGAYWQQENQFGYLQTGGYFGFPPAAMQHFRVVYQLFDNFQLPTFAEDLQNFCAATQTQYIVAGPGTPAALTAALGRLGWDARRIDDVTVYSVPANRMVHG